MIDGANGVLMGIPRTRPHDPARTATPASAPSAQEVSAAYQVISKSLAGKTLDAKHLAAAAAEARRYALLREQAIAEAELEAIAQYNAQHPQAGPAKAGGAFARAAKQLGKSAVFDADTVAAAQHALETGNLPLDPGKTVASLNLAGCVAGQTGPLPVVLKDTETAPSLADATDRLNAYLASGMSLSEAVGMLRVENGANRAAESILARAALATQAPAYVTKYAQAPDGPDPIALASAQIHKLRLFQGDTLAHATQAMTMKLPDAALDSHAARSAATTLAHDKPGSAQFAADMQAYRSALVKEIAQASGKHDTGWLNDPANIDAWLKTEVAVAGANLSPTAQAAAGTSEHSPEHKALTDQSNLLNLALEEARVIADVEHAAPAESNNASPAARTQGDLARTRRLTSDLSALGVVRFDEKSQQWISAGASRDNPDTATMLTDVLGDASIHTLKQHDVADVMPHAGAARPESSDQAKADLRATSNALAPFKQGGVTIFYGDMEHAVENSAPIRQRLDDIASSVHESGAVGYAHAVAQTLQDVEMPADADLTRALYQAKFRGRFEDFLAHGTWRAPSGLSSLWQSTDAPKYYVDASNVYAALGDDSQAAFQTQQGASLMNVVKKRMEGNDFVGRTYQGSLTKNGPEQKIKSYYLNWKDKHGVWGGHAQLFQDIGQSEPKSDTTRFIKAELPIGVDAAAPGEGAPAYEPPDAQRPAGGTQVVTSQTQLINVLGDAYKAKPRARPTKDGVRYDSNGKVYGDTTLGQLAQAALNSQGTPAPSVEVPLELTMLPLLYWRQGRDPNKDDPETLNLIQTDGTEGRRFVGPANRQTFDSYSAWTRASGFGAGMMLSTQHLIQTPTGASQLWDQTLTGQKKLSNGEILLQAGEGMASMAAVAVVSFVSPEAEGLLMPLLYDGAQTYFAVTGFKMARDASERIARDPASMTAWAEGGWAVAANSFTALSIASHFGMTRLPSMLARAFEAGQASQDGAQALALPTRLLVSAADNTAGAKTYMALAGAPDSVLAAQRVALKSAALTNGVLLGTQGIEVGTAWANGQPVSPTTVLQFIATVGMGQFGRLYHVKYSTNTPAATSDGTSKEEVLSDARQERVSAKSVIFRGVEARGDTSRSTAEFDSNALSGVSLSQDGRIVTLTDAGGRSLDAPLLGGRETPPTLPEDLLMPAGEKRGQRFEALRDPHDGMLVIVPRVRGGAVDEDPEAGGEPAQTRVTRALYDAVITPVQYRELLNATRTELLPVNGLSPARSASVEALRTRIELQLEHEASRPRDDIGARRTADGEGAQHDADVRYIVNNALLVARATFSPADLQRSPLIDTHAKALDLIVGIRTLNTRNSESLVLRDADHYLSNLVQEWQIPFERSGPREDRSPSTRLARFSGAVARVYDLTKSLQLRSPSSTDLSGETDLSNTEPRDIPASAPGGRGWAALGTRDFLRLAKDAGAPDHEWVVRTMPGKRVTA